jgi:hypothetical protein
VEKYCNLVALFVWFLRPLIGSYRNHGQKNNPSLIMSGMKRTHLGSFFCLIAILAHLVLPLAHQGHLHALEGLYTADVSDAGREVKLLLGSAESEEPQHSHHHANSCPICLAALSSRYFAAPTFSLTQVLYLPIQRFFHKTIASAVANPDILVSGPRSPPISL